MADNRPLVAANQLTYSWIARQLQAGTSLGRCRMYLGRISNLRPVLDSSAQTTRGNVLDLFVKPKNGLI